MAQSKKIAVVRVRGLINLHHSFKRTFEQLNLHNKNWCIVVDDTPEVKGMINKVKDYVTWGEIDDEMLESLVKARGEEYKSREADSKDQIKYNKFFVHNKKKYKRYFRLAPPKKGYGREGVKESFNNNGALGYRGDKIKDLLSRMI